MKTVNFKKMLNFRSLALASIVVLASVFVSCEQDEDMIVPEPEMELNAELDIEETLTRITEDPDFFPTLIEGDVQNDETLKRGWITKRPTFRNLTYALVKTRLFWTVVRNELTIFAPSDEAFNKFLKANGFKSIRQVPKETLKTVLLYHVVEGKVRSGDLTNGFVPTLNGAAVKVDLSSGVMINDASVEYANIRALNGIIHIIDEVLFPPTQNIVEIAQSLPDNFSILVDAVIAADLAGILSGDGPFTVFAPTNTAFANLLSDLGVSDLNGLVAAIGIENVKKVLLYHVVSGRVYSSDLPLGPVDVTTLSGGTFEIDVTLPGIKDFNGDQSNLIPSLLDIQGTNGVIHVIDKVIVPEL
ncbi:fasciclin domain-containing protein [uncultured Draconibacterium sp.]|uniref:fasciclin domain-containing protein n=1 Tax=uncultured Draconibacterium sp. TaxID=1573823 RepID=UPI0032609041